MLESEHRAFSSTPDPSLRCPAPLLPRKGRESQGNAVQGAGGDGKRGFRQQPQLEETKLAWFSLKTTTAPLPPPVGASPRDDAVPTGASPPQGWEREPKGGETPKFLSCFLCSLGCDSLLAGASLHPGPRAVCFPFGVGRVAGCCHPPLAERWGNALEQRAGQQGPVPAGFSVAEKRPSLRERSK